MIPRRLTASLEQHLRQFPAVALLGPRQVGKTTLAGRFRPPSETHYLDLENPADLERDISQLDPRIPAITLRRFWTMLAHCQGGLLNAAQLARSLAVDGKTVAKSLDFMVDLLLVRRLPPFHANLGKRLVKSPKTYCAR